MSRNALAPSLTADVYGRLRADLLACRLEPGRKLKIEDLCERLGAGSSAVREALTRLAADGFVVQEPQRGFRVAPLSVPELRDLVDVRCRIEEMAMREAIASGGIEWEADVIAALHRLTNTPERAPDDPARFNDAMPGAHTGFHATIVSACPSPWLLRIREQLFSQYERYRWLSGPLAKTMNRDLNAEHTEIALAAIERRADEAVDLLVAHLKASETALLTSPLIDKIAGPAPARR